MAKPENHPGKGKQDAATLTLRLTYDRNSDGLPNFGDQIIFDVTVPEGQTWHQVNVTCAQNGVPVMSGIISVDNPQPLSLESGSYTSGASDGHAELVNYSEKKPLATLDFAVGA